MTNQTTEILELAVLKGATYHQNPYEEDEYVFYASELLAFASALRSQDAARVAMLVEALKEAQAFASGLLGTFGNDSDIGISYLLDIYERALSAAQPSAAAYVAEVEARVLEEAEKVIWGKYTANETIWICNDLHQMAAEKRKQAEQGKEGTE